MTGGRVLLWDFDGTLGHHVGGWPGALLEALDTGLPGHRYQPAEVAAVLSTGFPWHEPDTAHPHLSSPGTWWRHMTSVLTDALIRLGLPPSGAAGTARLVAARYTDPAGWRLFDDTIPALTELTRRGWRHAVLSNHVPELPAIIEALGLTSHFDVIINSAVTGYEKPHPEAFRLALAATGHPAQVWMIGDNPVADVAGAQVAGISGILVRTEDPSAARYSPGLAGIPDLIASAEAAGPTRSGRGSA